MRHPTLPGGWCQRRSARESELPPISLSLQRSQTSSRTELRLSSLPNSNEAIPVASEHVKIKIKNAIPFVNAQKK